MLHDVLIMVCYVQACRTPVSMDMMMGFLRDEISHYSDVFRYVEKLGGLVGEYFGPLADNRQDYWLPRSIIAGEAVLDKVEASSLRRVLTTFHTNVPPISICMYHVFRQHAYDHDIMFRAFHLEQDVREGVELYDKLYLRDDSPYLLQQKALFLDRHDLHDDAFLAIDKAVTLTGKKIPSIRNSHAIILFRANIGKPFAFGAQAMLQSSMDTLEHCYLDDERKPYHICAYGEQALQYRRYFKDDLSWKYLKTAVAWLQAGRVDSPWNSHIQLLLPRVEDSLRRANDERIAVQ